MGSLTETIYDAMCQAGAWIVDYPKATRKCETEEGLYLWEAASTLELRGVKFNLRGQYSAEEHKVPIDCTKMLELESVELIEHGIGIVKYDRNSLVVKSTEILLRDVLTQTVQKVLFKV